MAKQYCPSCMRKLDNGQCRTSWCSQFVSTGRVKEVDHGNTGRMRVPKGGTLKGGQRGRREASDVNTGLVADRGKVPPKSDSPGIAKAKARAERMNDKAKPKRNARDKKAARKEANKAIGKPPKEGSYDPDDPGTIVTVEGTMIEERRGLFGGKRYIIVKDPNSDIWED